MRPCGCIGQETKEIARVTAEKQLGRSLKDFRQAWSEKTPDYKIEHTWARFIKPLVDLEAKLERQHPKYGRPEQACEGCKGAGSVSTTYNPDSKWDWFSVGGRWAGYLHLKPGAKGDMGDSIFGGDTTPRPGRADSAKAGDIDWFSMCRKARADAAKRWAEYERDLRSRNDFSPYLRYGVEGDDTKASYIARLSSVATYAVLHEGAWHSKGEMGWWGVSHDEMTADQWDIQFMRLVAALDPDDEVTVVDCHI